MMREIVLSKHKRVFFMQPMTIELATHVCPDGSVEIAFTTKESGGALYSFCDADLRQAYELLKDRFEK